MRKSRELSTGTTECGLQGSRAPRMRWGPRLVTLIGLVSQAVRYVYKGKPTESPIFILSSPPRILASQERRRSHHNLLRHTMYLYLFFHADEPSSIKKRHLGTMQLLLAPVPREKLLPHLESAREILVWTLWAGADSVFPL